MATSFSIADITADVARLANVPAFSANSNVTSSQVTYWVIQAGRSLAALLRQYHLDDREYVSTATLTTTPDFSLVSLPSNCGEVSAVVWQKSDTDYRLLRSASQDDLVHQTSESALWEEEPRYRLEGQTIALYPPPATAETILVYYTSHLDLTGQTTFLSRLDADRWLTLEVVMKVLQAKQRDYSAFAAEKAQVEANLIAAARKRDQYQVRTIRDTRFERRRNAIRDRWGF